MPAHFRFPKVAGGRQRRLQFTALGKNPSAGSLVDQSSNIFNGLSGCALLHA